MSFISLLLLSFAMSTDAFAVSVCKGVTMRNPRFYDAIKVGVLFGVIEAITPVMGWLLGYMAVQYIAEWDHWIILLLMLFLGSRMIYNSFSKDPCCDVPAKDSLLVLILTAVSTSLDAFAVGIGLALANVNIFVAATLIGLATFIMVTIGIMLGKKLGGLIGKRAEFIGGIILILIGVWTVYEHAVFG